MQICLTKSLTLTDLPLAKCHSSQNPLLFFEKFVAFRIFLTITFIFEKSLISAGLSIVKFFFYFMAVSKLGTSLLLFSSRPYTGKVLIIRH